MLTSTNLPRFRFFLRYHHVTVLLYCWHAYATEASQALYFVAMNYTVRRTILSLCASRSISSPWREKNK